MKKNLLGFLCYIVLTLVATKGTSAQDRPIFSQFTLNPFQFNPSFAANNGYAEANVFYRKQWITIENAPEALAFNIQAPTGRNVSLGLLVHSQKTVLLANNLATATFAYRVRLGHNHHLNFGLAAGMAFNNFDMEALANSNDPALINVVQNSKYFTGQFGFNYNVKNFTIGLAFPNLFDSKANSTESLQQIDFNPFNNKFGSLSYRIGAGDFLLEPTLLYRALDNQQDQWEGMLIATYRNFIWVGASYREGYGITGLIGVRLKSMVRVGYAYENPTTKSLAQASGGSHEIYLGARLGKYNREEEIFAQEIQKDSLNQVAKLQQEQKPVAKEVVEEIAVVVKPEVQRESVKPVVVPQHQVQQEVPAKQDEPMGEIMQKIDQTSSPIPPGYYLVVGVYKLEDNALRNFSNLRTAGHNPKMIFVEEKGYFYIYLFYSSDRGEAVKELEKIRALNKFYGAWIYNRS